MRYIHRKCDTRIVYMNMSTHIIYNMIVKLTMHIVATDHIYCDIWNFNIPFLNVSTDIANNIQYNINTIV